MQDQRLLLPYLDGPKLDRAFTLRMMGDWGGANIHSICGWLAQEFWDRSPLEARTAIWNGRGGMDGIRALERREVDLAIVTPAEFAAMAYWGEGPFHGEPKPWLRALGRIPQDDRFIFAIDRTFGLNTIADVHQVRPALRIATSPDDGTNWIGWAARQSLEFAGIDAKLFAEWGCSFVEAERPPDCAQLVIDGKADAILHEGISGPWWAEMEARRPMSYIPFGPEVGVVADRIGWTSDRVPAGLFPVEPDFTTLNFDDFTILVRDDFPDDVADVLAWCIVETRGSLERKYRHLAPERSPIGHPMVPHDMVTTLVPLHPSAELRYRELGVL